MSRKQLTSVMIFLIAFLTIAAAAYAPHNARWQKVAQDNTVYAPCTSTMALVPQQVASAEKYPVPSPDVIARGHSAN